MNVRTALIVAMTLAVVPAMAQTQAPAASAQQKPAAQHQPATPVQSAQQSAARQSPAPEKVDPAKDAAIRRLLEVTEQTKMGEHISGAISMQVRSIMGRNLPEERLQKFMLDFDLKLHTEVPPPQFVDLAVPIYAQHFSLEDIQGLIQFYESPLGQRVVKTMPQVVQDSQSAGLELEKKATLAILHEMSDEYPELKPLLPSESKPSLAPAPVPAPTLAPGSNPAPPKN